MECQYCTAAIDPEQELLKCARCSKILNEVKERTNPYRVKVTYTSCTMWL